MSRRVKVIGAGSIGNHLSNAARALGWAVDLCDLDPAALRRAREEIYPARYGAWDEGISLHLADEAPKGGFDYIFIGTPPDSHISLARAALAEGPKAVHIEKPICTPDLDGADDLISEAKAAGVALFAGYDLVVGEPYIKTSALMDTLDLGPIETIDVDYREHWGGILTAHPWLKGPSDTYLGFWRRGGGASGEHSHALNLWQHLALKAGAGRVTEVSANMRYDTLDGIDCDRIAQFDLRTETGLLGRVVQDMVSKPTRKWARVQGRDGWIEYKYGVGPGLHSVAYGLDGADPVEETIKRSRPDDFIQELRHLDAAMERDGGDSSPLNITHGMDTMLLLAAGHRSAQTGRRIRINYNRGVCLGALSGDG